MSSLEIGAIVFACTFGGALVGLLLRVVIPDPHLTGDSKDVIKMGTGLLATLAALVLGLLIASAKSSFDSQRTGLQQMAANFVVIDRALAKYGPQTGPARESLHRLVEKLLEVQSAGTNSASTLGAASLTVEGGKFYDQIRELVPATDNQKWLQSQALQLAADFTRTRWLLNEQQGSAIPTPFLVIVVFWLTALFLSFGLFSAPNPVVIVTLLICALSVAGALFLIVDLDQPTAGLIRISERTDPERAFTVGQMNVFSLVSTGRRRSFQEPVVQSQVRGRPCAADGTGAGSLASAVHSGISTAFIQEVEKMMRPGTSALFLLDQEGNLDGILHRIRRLGGTVLKTNVDLDRAKLIQSTLGG